MATIYSASAAPWKNGGSSVEQWESGLVRVTQEYMVPRADRGTIAASTFARGTELTDIDSPATDGLYIYPDPTITDVSSGLSKITVTAYGRIQTRYSVEMTYLREDLLDGEISYVYYIPQYRIKWVTASGDLPLPSFLDDLRERDKLYLVSTTDESVTDYSGDRRYTYEASPSSNYGTFQEQVFTMTVYPLFA